MACGPFVFFPLEKPCHHLLHLSFLDATCHSLSPAASFKTPSSVFAFSPVSKFARGSHSLHNQPLVHFICIYLLVSCQVCVCILPAARVVLLDLALGEKKEATILHFNYHKHERLLKQDEDDFKLLSVFNKIKM